MSSNKAPTTASKRQLSEEVADHRHGRNTHKRQCCVQRNESSNNDDDFDNSPDDNKRSKVRARKSAEPITSYTSSVLWARALVNIESRDLGDKSTSKGSSKSSHCL